MQILQQLKNAINISDYSLFIDTIRIEFSLQYKHKDLANFGIWHKLKKDDFKYNQIKKRLSLNELSTVYQLENQNIYYYKKKEKKSNQKAIMVIFGIKQYDKPTPPKELMAQIIDTLCYKVDFTKYRDFEIDLCFDTNQEPNYPNIKQHFTIDKEIVSDRGLTCYINKPNLFMIRSVCIYDKASKNSLIAPLWRYEATIHIPNPKELNLPIDDFVDIIQKGMKR